MLDKKLNKKKFIFYSLQNSNLKLNKKNSVKYIYDFSFILFGIIA